MYSLLCEKGVLYTYRWPRNEFIDSIKKNEDTTLNIPYPEKFNWKYYYDKFLEVLLSEYLQNQMILLRNNAAFWCVNEEKIESFEGKFDNFRTFVEEVDEYFLERTNCICIDDLYASIPQKISCTTPTSVRSPEIWENIACSIYEAINGAERIRQTDTKYYNRIVKYINKRINNATRQIYKENLFQMQEKWIRNLEDYTPENKFESDLFVSCIAYDA